MLLDASFLGATCVTEMDAKATDYEKDRNS